MKQTEVHEMKFICEKISIVEEEFGCSITFAEKENGIAKEQITIDELFHSRGQYLMLMRKYRENEFEEDYLYLETDDPNKSGELANFLMNVQPNQFSISYDKDSIEILMNPKEQELKAIKYIIQKITGKTYI